MATILVVDDDAELRTLVAALLEDAGHIVREAIDGEHGLAVALDQPPDLVLSDIAMPVVDGAELAAALAAESPATPVLLMSGACPLPPAAPAPCLPKPFASDRLLDLVDDLLAARSGSTGPAGR